MHRDDGLGRRRDCHDDVGLRRGTLAVSRRLDGIGGCLASMLAGAQDMGDLVSHALDAGLGRGIGNRLPHLDLAHFGTGGKHARRHIGAHMAGARNKQFGCIRPSQPLGTERSGGTGAKSSDGGGIEQRQRLARRVVAQQRGAEDLGQPLFGILREPSSKLEAEEAASRQLARADIHIGHAGFELLIYHRPRYTLARCLLAICLLHGSDCILNRQHLGNFLGRKHHHLPHHRSSQRKLYVASLYGLVTMPPRIISCWNLQRFSI